MIQKQILALCLYQDFWKDARRILNAKMFPKELNSIFVAISDAHKKYETDFNIMELLLAHRDKFPAMPQATRDKHSKKPPIIKDKIVELCGDLSRIELFAREETKGWDCWGNEL